MNPCRLDQVVNAVLYEGYLLYPYRPSSRKNGRGRFTFGRVYPRTFSEAQHGAEPCLMQTQVLLQHAGPPDPVVLKVSARFLHPLWQEVGVTKGTGTSGMGSTLEARARPEVDVLPRIEVEGVPHQTLQEAVERQVEVDEISLRCGQRGHGVQEFAFPGERLSEPLGGRGMESSVVRIRRQESLRGKVEVGVEPVGESLWVVTVKITNETPVGTSLPDPGDDVLMHTMVSTHTVLQARNAHFVSLTDPPVGMRSAAEGCRNIGTWPVLLGEPGGIGEAGSSTMLSSPIILADYPQIAPESRGDFFDGTEIDEMLSLRVLTLTDEEKLEMRHADAYARRILERTEGLSEADWRGLHGTFRSEGLATELVSGPNRRLDSALANGVLVRVGDRVRVQPKGRADAMDMLLAGRTATVEAVELDTEDRVHFALVMDDDPGKDLGYLKQPGHRFFYRDDEVEALKGKAV